MRVEDSGVNLFELPMEREKPTERGVSGLEGA